MNLAKLENTFVANFAAGFEDAVQDYLENQLKFKIEILESGSVVFRANDIDLNDFRFASSLFLVLDRSTDTKLKIPGGVLNSGVKTFTVRFFKIGKPAKFESESERLSLIKRVESGSGLSYTSYNPDSDFCVIERASGFSWFGLKLNQSQRYKKGELHQDVVELLILSSGIKSGNALDAFAGYGGIAAGLISSKNLKLSEVNAVEIQSNLVNDLKKRFEDGPKVKVRAGNVCKFLNSSKLKFNLIIADPPWGDYSPGARGELKLKELYSDFLDSAQKSLAGSGRVVILSSKKDLLKKVVNNSDFQITKSLDVLISGKKVLVLVLKV